MVSNNEDNQNNGHVLDQMIIDNGEEPKSKSKFINFFLFKIVKILDLVIK